MNHLSDAGLGGRDVGIAFLGQHDRLHAMDLGGRAGQAAPLQVGMDVVEVPLLDQQAARP